MNRQLEHMHSRQFFLRSTYSVACSFLQSVGRAIRKQDNAGVNNLSNEGRERRQRGKSVTNQRKVSMMKHLGCLPSSGLTKRLASVLSYFRKLELVLLHVTLVVEWIDVAQCFLLNQVVDIQWSGWFLVASKRDKPVAEWNIQFPFFRITSFEMMSQFGADY